MNIQTNTSSVEHLSLLHLESSQAYGSIDVEKSKRDDVYNQIIERTKEYVSWVAPVNILQGLDYMKIEINVPGITRKDCKIGCSGVFLWVKLNKRGEEKTDTFYCTFILPENLFTNQLTASYKINGKLEIVIPKEKQMNLFDQ